MSTVMNEKDFLEFGYLLQEIDVEDEYRMQLVIQKLEESPEDGERKYLLDAAYRKKRNRTKTCSHEYKVGIEKLAGRWHRRMEPIRESYFEFLLDPDTLLKANEKKEIAQFHPELIEYAGSEERLELMKAIFRVREATQQFLNKKDGKSTPSSSRWCTLRSMTTIWD